MSFSGVYTKATIQNPNSALTTVPVFLDVIADSAWWAANTSTDKTKLRATIDIGSGEIEIPSHTFVFDSGTTNLKMMVGVPSAPGTGNIDIKIYQALTASPSYSRTDTYGQNAVYSNSAISRFFPFGGGTEATGKGSDLTGEGGVSEGGVPSPTGLGTDYNGSDQRFYGSTPITGRVCTFVTMFNSETAKLGGMLNIADSSVSNQQLVLTHNSTQQVLASVFAGSFNTAQASEVAALGTWNFGSFRSNATEFYARCNNSTASNTDSNVPTGLDTLGLGCTQDTTKLWFDGKLSWAWFFSSDIGTDWEDYLKDMATDNATFTGTWTTGGGAPSAISCEPLILTAMILGEAAVTVPTAPIICENLILPVLESEAPEARISIQGSPLIMGEPVLGEAEIIDNTIYCEPLVMAPMVLGNAEIQGQIVCEPLILGTMNLGEAQVIGEISCEPLVLSPMSLGRAQVGDTTPIFPDVIKVPGKIKKSLKVGGDLS